MSNAVDVFISYVALRSSVALSDIGRHMSNAGHGMSNPRLSVMLRRAGFKREGWDGTGYDRTPRYVRVQP